MGPEEFRIGVKRFLEKYKYGNAVTADLWHELTGVSSSELNITRIMDTWTRQMIKYTWEMLFDIWNERNKKLHETKHIEELEGVPVMQQAIKAEWEQGLGRLPASEFSKFFRQKVFETNDSIPSLQTWG